MKKKEFDYGTADMIVTIIVSIMILVGILAIGFLVGTVFPLWVSFLAMGITFVVVLILSW